MEIQRTAFFCSIITTHIYSNNMELLLLLLPLILIATTAVLISLFWFLNKNQNKTKQVLPLPPGTTGWPILGENIEFFSLGRKGIPEKFIQDRMKKYSSQVFKTSLYGQTMAIICGPEGNKFIFSNEGNLFHSWWPQSAKQIFPTEFPITEELKKVRNLVRGFSKPDTINRCTEVMDSMTKRHLMLDLDHKQEVIGYELATKYAFLFAFKLFLSMENPDQVLKLSEPFNYIMKGFTSLHLNVPGTPFNRAVNASNFIRNEIIKIIKQRKIDLLEKKMSEEDILSYMLRETDENGQFMNEANIAVKIVCVLIAGHDSISSLITFTMKYLAEFPHIYNAVFKEQSEIEKSKAPGELLNTEDILQKMSYTWNVVNEVMRLAPTLQGNFVEAKSDISYAGFSIPKGWKIHWNTYSTHTNPKYFPEPKRFDPSKFEGNGPAPYTFVPFGGGPRICPGVAYARSAILVFIHNLVIRYRWKNVLVNEKIIFDPLPRLVSGLRIHLQPHSFN